MRVYIRFIKPLMDFLIGLTGTILFVIPLFLIFKLLYSFGEDKGPVIFKHERLGRNGKKFPTYKFRSMRVDAEQILKDNPELYKKYVENSYKLPENEDPRLTQIGGFLRKTSIDEIPQFVNILKGEMSFIGPRPIVENELSEYTVEQQRELLSVKPGATGWWQVSGRSDVNYPERCELELYYPRKASFLLDVKIVLLTFKKVFLREGAH